MEQTKNEKVATGILAVLVLCLFMYFVVLPSTQDRPISSAGQTGQTPTSPLVTLRDKVSGCRTSDIDIDKLRAADSDSGHYVKITGRITNNCNEPSGVQIKITVYDKADEILSVDDIWPASIHNIPAHSEWPFEHMTSRAGFAKFKVNVIRVSAW